MIVVNFIAFLALVAAPFLLWLLPKHFFGNDYFSWKKPREFRQRVTVSLIVSAIFSPGLIAYGHGGIPYSSGPAMLAQVILLPQLIAYSVVPYIFGVFIAYAIYHLANIKSRRAR